MKIQSFQWLETIIHWKKGIFYQWVKKMAIFVLINARANGNIFRVKQSHISLMAVFLNTLYTQVLIYFIPTEGLK